MKIEICTNSIQSALIAQKGGAHRVELCCNLAEGGLTPSTGTLQLARKYLTIEKYPLIRPRIGDFYYSDVEFETMLHNIHYCREQEMDGVVFGVLKADNTIDWERNAILLEAAGSMSTTFHRAFDCLPDPLMGMEQVIELGFDRILTSGQQATAIAGKEIIRQLVELAKQRIIILPGGGLNSQNIENFIAYTGVEEVHLSAKKTITSGAGSLFAANFFETNEQEVVAVVDLVMEKG